MWALITNPAAVSECVQRERFEASVFRRHPLLITIRAELWALAWGSDDALGSVVFALVPSLEEQSRIERC